MYGTLFTLPPASQILASTSEYSNPFFSDFVPLIELVLGITIGVGFVIVVVYLLVSAYHKK